MLGPVRAKGLSAFRAATFALPIAALLASPTFATDCGTPITSGTGVAGVPVVFTGFGTHPDGRFFLLGIGDQFNSGSLPATAWLVNLGDLDGDGMPEFRIQVPLDGPGSWNDPRTVGCPPELPSRPPLVLLLHVAPEDLDGDGKFDVFEDTIIRNGVLDPGEDRDGDGRLTPPGGCEGVDREDKDCDGWLDRIDEDPNNNGRCDPGEPCDVDNDGVLEHQICLDTNHNGIPGELGEPCGEDRNGDFALDDRPVLTPDDHIPDENGNINTYYPYGSARPTPGGVIVASVAWNGTSYDFDAINTPARNIVAADGKPYRIIDLSRTPDIRPRLSAARLMALDPTTYIATWRFSLTVPGIGLHDDVGGTRVIITEREIRNIRTGAFLARKPSPPDGSVVVYPTVVAALTAPGYPLSAVSALPISPGSTQLLEGDVALHYAVETLNPFDVDGDGHLLPLDNCPGISNDPQFDADLDGLGDACDPAPAPSADGQWSTVAAPTVPGPRSGATAVYDPIGARVLLYGGSTDTRTWAFDGATWAPVATIGTPGPRSGHGMVYDTLRHRVLLFGGRRLPDSTDLNDLWSFDGLQWVNITPAVSPSPRSDLGLAFDTAHGLLVLFGGEYRDRPLSDTWTFDGSEWRFVPSSSSPPARSRFQMAFDESHAVTVINGGTSAVSPAAPFNDTWQFDGTRWLLVDHVGDLPPVWDGKMVYDPAGRQLILFGGNDLTLPPMFYPSPAISATRVFDGTTWKTLSTLGVPPPCVPAAVAFDTGRGVLVEYDGCTSTHHELQRPPDLDGDGIASLGDNCPLVPNPDQADSDGDGVGDACDNCVAVPNAAQRNLDGDAYGDACDFCPLDPDDTHVDSDGDGIGDECDCLPHTPGSGLPPEVGATVSVRNNAGDPATTIQWTADGGTALYDTYVGTIPKSMMGSRTVPYDDRCLEGDIVPAGGLVPTSDATMPAVGTGRYYLLSGRNDCGEGTLGAASTGAPRPAPYACGLPHPAPPVISDVQVSTSAGTSICPEYDTVVRAWLCSFGITPDMYTLVPGPGIEVRATSTDATIQVLASEAAPNGVSAGTLSVVASYRPYGPGDTLTAFDDGSVGVTMVPQVGYTPEQCSIDPAAGVCACSVGAIFPTWSHDPLAGDHLFTRQVSLLPSPSAADGSVTIVSATRNCLYRRTNALQVVSQDAATVPASFTIDAWDDAGNPASWPFDLSIPQQAPTFECLGDACACCLYFSLDPSTECKGLVGLIGVPGSGFETGLCNTL
jgi:hypothetical protein